MSEPFGALTRVVLAFVPERVNNRLRFGNPKYELVLDRWRNSAHFLPGAVFCRVCWLANDYGTTLWLLSVLQAGRPGEALQRMAGVLPGAHRLLHVSGELKVKEALHLIDGIALGLQRQRERATGLVFCPVGHDTESWRLRPGYVGDGCACSAATCPSVCRS
jgi:hypothetical protein